MITGVPDHVDGRMLGDHRSGRRLRVINRDRMWHYVEGIRNWEPIWTGHGIRILPGPSSLWLDARGKRLPVPLYPGFDTLGTLEHIMSTGYDYSWFILTRRSSRRSSRCRAPSRTPISPERAGARCWAAPPAAFPAPVKAFMEKGEDFIVEASCRRWSPA